MNPNQLRFANAVASTGSFTSAAAQCCVTQPTLSNAIAQLEECLGERLFVRTTRKVALTPFGAHLLPYIGEVLGAQAALVEQAQRFLGPSPAQIRIGTSPLISAPWLSRLIGPFQLRHPAVELQLREMNMTELSGQLAEGRLDFVFGVVHLSKGPWISTPLYEEPLLFIPRGAALPAEASAASVALKDIAAETYVMVPDACGLSTATRSLFRSHRRKLHEYSGQAMSYQVLQQWAALGLGAAILPRSKVTEGGRPALAIIDRSGGPAMVRFEARWSRHASPRVHLSAFADHLRLPVSVPAF